VAKTRQKTFFIKTYGCAANEADARLVGEMLGELGWCSVSSLEDADIFIINSCSVRQKSEDKVYGLGKKLLEVVAEKSSKPFVVLAGCMVGSAKGDRKRYELEMLKKKMPWIDLFVSPSELKDLDQLLEDRGVLSSECVTTDMLGYSFENPTLTSPKENHANVNISTGCDNFCTYCVVPYARGEEISRTQEEILAEVGNLVDKGIDSVTLCGQNVNSWGLSRDEKFRLRAAGEGKLPFVDLLKAVHKIEGIKEIDFLSSNPFDFTQDLIDALKLPKISNYIHVAAQSGNNDVLRRMNRRHTVEEFIELINRIRKVRPNMEFGTDAIVGFPGETREQFMDTAELFTAVKFSVAFISMYSPRKGTVAEQQFVDDVSLKEKKYRHKFLTQVWKDNKP
jgi:tRNA-2-methylthio-N6-dimethylallyladenosine synthase